MHLTHPAITANKELSMFVSGGHGKDRNKDDKKGKDKKSK